MQQAQKHIVLLNDKTIIELDFAKYRDSSVSRRSIICLYLRHRQIIDLLATDKSRYFAQPRPIILLFILLTVKRYRKFVERFVEYSVAKGKPVFMRCAHGMVVR